MSTSLGRGRGARVKLDSKVGRQIPTKPQAQAARELVFPHISEPQHSLLESVVKALKSGCVTIEQLVELSTFLVNNGSKLESTHSEVIGELFQSLRDLVHSKTIPAPRLRSVRYAVLRLLEIRSQGWSVVASAEAYYNKHLHLLSANDLTSYSEPSSQQSANTPSLSSSNQSTPVTAQPTKDESWETLSVEVESVFNEPSNALATPSVQQFNCVPEKANSESNVNGIKGPSSPSRLSVKEPQQSEFKEVSMPETELRTNQSHPGNLHSRYLTNSKGQTLIISSCSPLISGMAENILLRQIPTLESIPTPTDSFVVAPSVSPKIKTSTRDSSVQCNLLTDKADPVDIYVRNLSEDVDEKQLRKAFDSFGSSILSVRISTNQGVSRGYGFVSFDCLESANRAITAMNGTEFQRQKLYVALAQHKEDHKSERNDEPPSKPDYSHFTKANYQRSKSETSSIRSMRFNEESLFGDTDICGIEDFGGAGDTGPSVRPSREAPLRESGVKWHVTGKTRGVALPRTNHPRGDPHFVTSYPPPHTLSDSHYEELEAEIDTEDDTFSGIGSPESLQRVPLVLGPWLKMGLTFAENEKNYEPDGEAQPMDKLLLDIPSTMAVEKYRQYLLALSLSPLSQEPPLENWDIYCRQYNDCCVECMTEAFHPLRYLEYWQRTSPRERYSRRPAYEEHDHRRVDYSKIYGSSRSYNNTPRLEGSRDRINHITGPAKNDTINDNKQRDRDILTDSTDFTVVTSLGSPSSSDVITGSRELEPPAPQTREILYEAELSALISATDFDSDDGGTKAASSCFKKASLLVNVNELRDAANEFDFNASAPL